MNNRPMAITETRSNEMEGYRVVLAFTVFFSSPSPLSVALRSSFGELSYTLCIAVTFDLVLPAVLGQASYICNYIAQFFQRFFSIFYP